MKIKEGLIIYSSSLSQNSIKNSNFQQTSKIDHQHFQIKNWNQIFPEIIYFKKYVITLVSFEFNSWENLINIQGLNKCVFAGI
jgi:hypothetical protein